MKTTMRRTNSLLRNLALWGILHRLLAEDQQTKRKGGIRYVALAAVALLLLFVSYPAFEPDYSAGLDSSYVWGLNYLFSHDYEGLLHLIHPYGPLALLRLPVIDDGHFVVFLAFYSFVKLLFIVLCLQLAMRHGMRLWLAAVFLLLPCLYAVIDTLVVFDVALLLFFATFGWQGEVCHRPSRGGRVNVIFYVSAVLLAAVALFIKSSIGLEALSVVFVAWLLSGIISRDMRSAALQTVIVLLMLMAVGMVVYRDVSLLAGAFEGIVHQVLAHGEAMTLEAALPLWRLVVVFVLLALYPFFARGWQSRWLFLILLVPLFLNYKHGVIRADFWHYKNSVVSFMSAFVVVLPMVMCRRFVRCVSWAMSAVCFLLIVSIVDYTNGYGGQRLRQGDVLTGWNMTVHYDNLREVMEHNVASSMERHRLPDAALRQIGDGTVDCYPWEQLFAGANGLRWQPRATFEMASSLSPWLGQRAAANYGEDSTAADYVIWHRANYSDVADMNAIDGSYILSEEPRVVEALLSNYHVADTGWYGMLLKHNEVPTGYITNVMVSVIVGYDSLEVSQRRNEVSQYRAPEVACGEWLQCCWDEWVDVPVDSGVVKAYVDVSQSLYGRVKTLVYKSNICWIDYLMPDSSVTTYRFIPSMAAEGLWVSPMIERFDDLALFIDGENVGRRPLAVRFRTSHPAMVSDTLKVQFRHR